MSFADTLKSWLAKAKAGGGSSGGSSSGGYGQSGQQQPDFTQSQGKFGQDDTRSAAGQSGGMSGDADQGMQPGGDKLNEPPQSRGGHVIDEGEDAIDRYGKDL